MFELFDDNTRQVMVSANDQARLLGHHFIGSEHLLLGLVSNSDSQAAAVMAEAGIGIDRVLSQIEQVVGRCAPITSSQPPPLTPRCKGILERATREAGLMGHGLVRPEHLLIALCKRGDGTAVEILSRMGIDPRKLSVAVIRQMNNLPAEPEASTIQLTAPRDTILAIQSAILESSAASDERLSPLLNALKTALA